MSFVYVCILPQCFSAYHALTSPSDCGRSNQIDWETENTMVTILCLEDTMVTNASFSLVRLAASLLLVTIWYSQVLSGNPLTYFTTIFIQFTKPKGKKILLICTFMHLLVNWWNHYFWYLRKIKTFGKWHVLPIDCFNRVGFVCLWLIVTFYNLGLRFQDFKLFLDLLICCWFLN